MNRGVAILAVCALFLSGVAIGAVGMFLYVHQVVRSGEPRFDSDRVMRRGHLVQELDLSDEQHAQVRAILEESWREGAEMRRKMRPEVEALMGRTRAAIEEVLTPEQLAKFEQMRRLDRRPIERLLLGPSVGHPGSRRPGEPAGPRGRRRPPRE